tara:strand:- start:209 stop:547 length:339 start_codon:yes stop_codon:yes gene_type:complete
MNYEHKPTNTILELWNSKGSLFQNGKLVFRGDGYIAIKMFIDKTGNAPEVVKRFKSQLSMREEVKWKKRDEEVKAKEKAKADEMKHELENTKTTKKTTPKKTRTNKMDNLFN